MEQSKLKRIFVNTPIARGTIQLDDSVIINRLANVLRLQRNDEIVVFNSQSGEWRARISEISKRKVILEVLTHIIYKENNFTIALAFSPIKHERMKFMVEKCTEIGVSKFIPVVFDRTIVREVNESKLYSYLVGACEQSGRVIVPEILRVHTLSELLETHDSYEIIFCNEKEDDFFINNVSIKDKQIIIVGPEGGFTGREQELLQRNRNVQSISLGHNILRAETASIFAVSYIAALQMSK